MKGLKGLVALIAVVCSPAAVAVVQTHTGLVENVLTGRGRINLDYGNMQVVMKSLPAGTTCASSYTPAVLAKTFFFAGGTTVQGMLQKQSYENFANIAAAQELPVTIEYDTAGCTAGFGINIISITITPPPQ